MRIINSKFNFLLCFWFTIPPVGFALTYGYAGWIGLGSWVLLTILGGLSFQKSRNVLSTPIEGSNKAPMNKKTYTKCVTKIMINFATCYFILSFPLFITLESGEIRGWMYVLWTLAAAFYSYVRYKKDQCNS